MTNLAKLKHFMAPYYQDASDETLLTDYLANYAYPECAASALWYELRGSKGLELEGVQKIDTGAEKFVYSEPGTIQLACGKQGDYFAERCNMLTGSGSAAIKTSGAKVAGVSQNFGRDNE